MAEQLAAFLFSIIKTCDYALDIHTPTRGGRYVPIAILPHKDLPAYGKAEAFAEALDTGWIMQGNTGMYVSRGILCVEATRAGIPSFTFEIGEGGRLEPEMVRIGAGSSFTARSIVRPSSRGTWRTSTAATSPVATSARRRSFTSLCWNRSPGLNRAIRWTCRAEKGGCPVTLICPKRAAGPGVTGRTSRATCCS